MTVPRDETDAAFETVRNAAAWLDFAADSDNLGEADRKRLARVQAEIAPALTTIQDEMKRLQEGEGEWDKLSSDLLIERSADRAEIDRLRRAAIYEVRAVERELIEAEREGYTECRDRWCASQGFPIPHYHPALERTLQSQLTETRARVDELEEDRDNRERELGRLHGAELALTETRGRLEKMDLESERLVHELDFARQRAELDVASLTDQLEKAKAALERIDLLTENHVQTPEILVDTIHVLARQAITDLSRETDG